MLEEFIAWLDGHVVDVVDLNHGKSEAVEIVKGLQGNEPLRCRKHVAGNSVADIAVDVAEALGFNQLSELIVELAHGSSISRAPFAPACPLPGKTFEFAQRRIGKEPLAVTVDPGQCHLVVVGKEEPAIAGHQVLE